ncbi:response regulator transcription factor [Tissierella pigra]|uniref:Response regulator transcription factor n=1 Tax=Tissierella pigra TaxID=2607614 RepID=A0A6N7Y2M7_9FIRM|nr:response regulator transcription factor [Tissierella pigra]MBU5427761.1 response regulator transcription factor [Tissierella pigra]MSU02708.1 response regulator transcription factor [Tissierella pigra]
MAKILVIDDDIGILDLVDNILSKSGHFIKKINQPEEVFNENLNYYDLIILDIMMPNIDGFQLCSRIREKVDYPILFLTAKVEEADIIKGLGLGADDYLTKPFGVQELRARVDAHLRREQREKTNSMSIGNIRFLMTSKECFVLEDKVGLTKSEYEISEYLALNHGQIFSKEQIFERVFGFEKDSNLSAIVEHIKNIRAKFLEFNEEPIKTVWGVGYKWD